MVSDLLTRSPLSPARGLLPNGECVLLIITAKGRDRCASSVLCMFRADSVSDFVIRLAWFQFPLNIFLRFLSAAMAVCVTLHCKGLPRVTTKLSRRHSRRSGSHASNASSKNEDAVRLSFWQQRSVAAEMQLHAPSETVGGRCKGKMRGDQSVWSVGATARTTGLPVSSGEIG